MQRAVISHGQALEQRPDPEMVLLGQHLGRRHEGPLESTLNPGEQRGHRHDGLAAAHVALQQAVHGVGAGQIALDLVDCPLLGRGQRERQPVAELGHQTAVDDVADPPGLPFDGALAS